MVELVKEFQSRYLSNDPEHLILNDHADIT